MKLFLNPFASGIPRTLLLLLGAMATGAKEAPAIPVPSASQAVDVSFSKPSTWLFGDGVAPPRIPLVGDLNGDGYADFLYASPKEKFIDLSLNGKGWKSMRGERLVSDLPQTVAAMALGHFGGSGLDLVVLGEQGRLVKILNDGSGKLSAPKTVAEVSSPGPVAWVAAVRLDPKSDTDEIAVITGDGRGRVYDSRNGTLISQFQLPAPVKNVAARIDKNGLSTLAVLTGKGLNLYRMGNPLTRLAALHAPKGQAALALGDVNADGQIDALVNGIVFLGPDFRHSVPVPGWEQFDKPVTAALADVFGHGRSDVVVQHEGKDYYGSTEADCNVYATFAKNDPDWDFDGLTNAEEAQLKTDPLQRDTDGDGLLDGWEAHGFAGIDFPGLGASPRHKDVFVMNLPYDTIPIDQMETYMRERVAPFFADLPSPNPDGTKGFAIHWSTLKPVYDVKGHAGKSWGQAADETFPKEKIGYFHWMLIGGMGGGGQSDQLADRGSTGMGSWIHEFGHQLGLSHTGKWDAWSPTYTSLMNYSYSYRFDGDPKKVHFSTGELASLVLNESRLPGKVPFPMEKVQFLAGPPYHFPMKPAGKDATYIDWGWSGVFSDRTVRANITFGYGVSGGYRLQPSGTQSFHYDGPFELMTDDQASLAEHKGKLYMLTASRPPVSPDAPRPDSATLVMQTYQGKRAWSPPTEIEPKVTGDPFAASDGRTFYVFYPTAEGVRIRFGQPDHLGEAQLIPGTKGASVSAVDWNGTLHLLTYRGPDETITDRTVRGKELGPEVDLGIKSAIPPGPAVDTIHHQLLLGTAGPFEKQAYRWQLRRFDWDVSAKGFKEKSWAFVGGEKSGWAGNRRPTLIFNASREFGPQGRIYWIAAGLAQPMSTPTAFFLAQTTGYPAVNDGWLLWRYYDEWTNTRSGIGAAWFDRDIVLATTWAAGSAGGDGGVFCAYNGTTISNVDMGDFDDISLMANYGMARSIYTLAEMPAVGTGK